MLAKQRYVFLSCKGRAALLALDALGTTRTALHGFPAYGPPRPLSSAHAAARVTMQGRQRRLGYVTVVP